MLGEQPYCALHKLMIIKFYVFFRPPRDEAELQPTFKIKMSRDGDVCTLQMSGVTLKMSGEYRCVAVNSAGEAVCAANVAVVGEFWQVLELILNKTHTLKCGLSTHVNKGYFLFVLKRSSRCLCSPMALHFFRSWTSWGSTFSGRMSTNRVFCQVFLGLPTDAFLSTTNLVHAFT